MPVEFDFGNNEVVESLDTVPEAYKELYVAGEDDNDGKFVISEGAKGIVAAYVGTQEALQKSRNDKTKASDESAKRRIVLNSYDEMLTSLGIEVDDEDEKVPALKNHINELVEANKAGKQLKVDLDKIKGEFQKKQGEVVAGKDKEIDKLKKDLFATKVTDEARRAIAEEKGSSELLLPLIEKQCKVIDEEGVYQVRVIDNQQDARTDGSGGWLTVKDYVREMKTKAEFARAFDSETKSGTGKDAGSGKSTPPPKEGEDKSSLAKISDGLSNM